MEGIKRCSNFAVAQGEYAACLKSHSKPAIEQEGYSLIFYRNGMCVLMRA